MSWLNFSTYRKRIVDFQHDGTEIHLVFLLRGTNPFSKHHFVEVKWRASKFKGMEFSFTVDIKHGCDPDWKQIFKKLRMSLAYGLNPAARMVTDKLLQINPSSQNKIHRVLRTTAIYK